MVDSRLAEANYAFRIARSGVFGETVDFPRSFIDGSMAGLLVIRNNPSARGLFHSPNRYMIFPMRPSLVANQRSHSLKYKEFDSQLSRTHTLSHPIFNTMKELLCCYMRALYCFRCGHCYL
jgi:hypothetical protein